MKHELLSDPPKRIVFHPLERPKRDIPTLGERFGEDVCNLLCYRTITQIDDLLMNHLPEKMHVNLNMFGPLMMNEVLRDLDGTLVVMVDD
jgi:hypothetical protein